jgi:hypothetical protein
VVRRNIDIPIISLIKPTKILRHDQDCCFADILKLSELGMSDVAFQDSPPLTDRVNAYDEAHLVTYLRLLDANEEGADWREVVRIIFGLDAETDRTRAWRVYDSHLARARWMTEVGYRHLLQPPMQ